MCSLNSFVIVLALALAFIFCLHISDWSEWKSRTHVYKTIWFRFITKLKLSDCHSLLLLRSLLLCVCVRCALITNFIFVNIFDYHENAQHFSVFWLIFVHVYLCEWAFAHEFGSFLGDGMMGSLKRTPIFK